MRRFLLSWLATFLAVYVAAALLPDRIHFASAEGVAVFAIALGLLNAFVEPVVKLLTFPINLMTFGLFTLVINALMFWLAATLTKTVSIDSFVTAFIAAIIVSVVGLVVQSAIKN